VLAGRLLSLAAVLAIAFAIALMVRRLGGDRAGALIGAAFFVATMSRFCVRYVGMDDPQLPRPRPSWPSAFAGFPRGLTPRPRLPRSDPPHGRRRLHQA